MQPAENPTKSDKVHPLSLEPFSDKHTCDPHKNIETGMEVGDESFIVGRPKLPPSKVHEVTSPLKSIKEPLISLETTNTPLSPKRGNWKRVARTQGKKFQNVNPQTQNVAGLSSSKSIGKLDFMDKGEGTPQKKKKKNSWLIPYRYTWHLYGSFLDSTQAPSQSRNKDPRPFTCCFGGLGLVHRN